MRGTDRRRNILIFKYLDSSPLTRGRHRNNTPSRCTRRFIPSCEGQTHSVFMWLSAALNTSLNNLRIISSTYNMPKKYFFCHFSKYFLYFFNPYSIFIIHDNFFVSTHTVIFCVYLYIFENSCFRLTEILEIFNF